MNDGNLRKTSSCMIIRYVQYFGRDVVGRSAKCRGQLALGYAFFAHAEIGYLAMTLAVEQDIVEL